MDIPAYLASMEAALADAEADLSTDLGGHHEVTRARLWRGQVLVDWEPDTQAGGCLLRPQLVWRLMALHAQVDDDKDAATLHLTASGRIVAALGAEHADLVTRLGGARRVELRARLRFVGNTYTGGQETYYLVERGQRLPLLRLQAAIRPVRGFKLARGASPRTSPAPT